MCKQTRLLTERRRQTISFWLVVFQDCLMSSCAFLCYLQMYQHISDYHLLANSLHCSITLSPQCSTFPLYTTNPPLFRPLINRHLLLPYPHKISFLFLVSCVILNCVTQQSAHNQCLHSLHPVASHHSSFCTLEILHLRLRTHFCCLVVCRSRNRKLTLCGLIF